MAIVAPFDLGIKTAVSTLPANAWPVVRNEWRSIAAASANTSFFLTPEVTEAWLKTVGRALHVEICRFTSNARVVGLALLVRKRVRVGGLPMRALHLNCAGEDFGQSLCTEYNDVLTLPGYEEACGSALAKLLRSRGWDYLHLDGVQESPAVRALQARVAPQAEPWSRKCYYVDLQKIRETAGDYLMSLSKNTRSHLRRSLKLYETTYGPVRLEVAQDRRQALAFLDELIVLHQESWIVRGERGAFANPAFTELQRTIVRDLFDSGMIQMTRATAGERVIGVLYNFVYRNKVYSYQSGFTSEELPRMKSGMTCHHLTVEYCLAQGYREYDFMAGDFRYKEQLMTDTRLLEWCRIPSGNLRTRVLELARSARRRLRPTPAGSVPQESESEE